MKLSELQAGTRLELEVYEKSEQSEQSGRNILISEFEWGVGEEAIIAAPIHSTVVYPVHSGTLVNVYFIVNSNLYTFKAEVLGRESEENIPLLRIVIKSEIERIQRRQFYRFRCSLPVKYRIIESLDQPNEQKGDYKEALLRDISGGGIYAACNDEVNKDQFIECEIKLTPSSTINFLGRIVRVGTNEQHGKYKYNMGIIFEKIENKSREVIISYIFQEQRKLLKKGLI